MDIKKILSELTLEEKCALLSGIDNWHTVPISRLGIPSTMMSDGPAGLRKENNSTDIFGNSQKATSFPLSVTQASTWNLPLIEKMGGAIALEAIDQGVDTVLGPGVNIKRSPLCGRNFEYFSEDPYLAGKMGGAFIKGVQSKGIGTSLKHYAVNNQETLRMTISADVGFKALHEIYLRPFEIAVKDGNPATVMAAYNRVNHVYATENPYLLNDILLKHWGYEGMVVSDWHAVVNRVSALKAGLHLQMPSDGGLSDELIRQAVLDNQLDVKVLDERVETILRYIDNIIINKETRKAVKYDYRQGHETAREVGIEGAVLLKNEYDLLPLDPKGKYAVLGDLAKVNRIAGSGSSIVNPYNPVTLFGEFDRKHVDYVYTEGTRSEYGKVRDTVRDKDAVLVFIGLSGFEESEGFDRTHLRMKEEYSELIDAVYEVNKNIVVVLSLGSPVEMPFAGKCRSILNMYLQGEVFGETAYDLLFGIVSPSGHLAETFPLKLSDTPSFGTFPMGPYVVEYKEGTGVGYRHYESQGTEVLFPFGHGLTYGKVGYSSLRYEAVDDPFYKVKIFLKVKNTGRYAVKEVIQLYLSYEGSTGKELKKFLKIDLGVDEEKEVMLLINKDALKSVDDINHQEVIRKGKYSFFIGASVKDIRLQGEFDIDEEEILSKLPEFNTIDSAEIKDNSFRYTRKNFDDNATLLDLRKNSFGGKIFYNVIVGTATKKVGGSDNLSKKLLTEALNSFTIRQLVSLLGGSVSYRFADALVDIGKGRLFKGLIKIVKDSKQRRKGKRKSDIIIN